MIGDTPGLMGLVTTREAAKLLGVSTTAVRQRIHRFHIPVIYVGAALLVSLADLQRAVSPRNRPAMTTDD